MIDRQFSLNVAVAITALGLANCSSSTAIFGTDGTGGREAAGAGGSAGGSGKPVTSGTAAGGTVGGRAGSSGASQSGSSGTTGQSGSAGGAGAPEQSGSAGSSGTTGAAGLSGLSGGVAGAGGGEAATAGLPSKLACADRLVPPTGIIPSVSTDTTTDRQTLSCGLGASPEALFDWLVPRTDYYTISTAGSDFDTVLGVRADTCDGAELACNDDANAGAQSELVQRFEAGQRVVLVADGKAGDSGNVNLTVAPVTCPSLDVTGQALPLTTNLTTVGGASAQAGKCGGAGRAERTIRWVPPADGLYRFTATSETFDPALHLEHGARCGGELLGCNATTSASYPTQITRRLKANDPVTLIVDSTRSEGAFTLDVSQLTSACPSRTTADVPRDETEAVSLAGMGNVLSGSCVPSGGLVNYAKVGYPDFSFARTLKLCDTCREYHVFHGSAPFAVYLIKGQDCSGPEVSCAIAERDETAGDYTLQLTFGPKDSGDYVFVVESIDNIPTSFWLDVMGIA